MLDEYVFGTVDRISPEAPVPVVNISSKKYCLGGASNVALNLKSLGAEVYLSGVLGNDEDGKKSIKLLHENHINTDGIITSNTRVSTRKSRVISGTHQMLRMDEEDTHDLNNLESSDLLTKISHLINSIKPQAIIFEDYNKGCLTKQIISSVIDLAIKNNIFTAVDPKKKNFFEYKDVNLFKPNLKELREGLNIDINTSDLVSIDTACKKLMDSLNCKNVLLTLSKHGVFYKNNLNTSIIPAFVRNISDVSGAGDTVISMATLSLLSGLTLEESAWVANLAGGLVCEKPGVDVITTEEILAEMNKI